MDLETFILKKQENKKKNYKIQIRMKIYLFKSFRHIKNHLIIIKKPLI